MAKEMDTLRAIAMTVAGVAWALFTLVLPVVGVPLAAAALASLALGGRHRLAAGTAVVGIGVTAVLSPPSAVFTAPALLAGPASVWALRRYRAASVLVVLTVTLFAAAVGSDSLALALDGRSIVSEAKVAAEKAATFAGDAVTRLADDSTARLVREQLHSLSATVFMLWPASYFETAALTALLAVLAVGRAASLAGASVNRLPRLSEVDVSVHIVWFVAVAMLLFAASPLVPAGSRLLAAVAGNMLLMARLPLLAQGAGVTAAALGRLRVGRMGGVVAFVFLAVAEIALYVVSIVGLADMWMNFRRLPRESGRAPETAPE